jgi:hypothetical protein
MTPFSGIAYTDDRVSTMRGESVSDLDQPAVYAITVLGELNERWALKFGGMTIESKTDTIPMTTLRGVIPDQAALRGMLIQLWDLGLVLMSVTYIATADETELNRNEELER